MKTKIDRRLIGLVAAGLAGSAATVATAQPYVIKISGATLQQNFWSKPASSNDWLDCDGNGTAGSLGSVSIQQLAPGLPSNPYPANQFWLITYRATGSVNGLKELIANGRTYATNDFNGDIKASTADVAYINRTQYINAGVSSNASLFNEGNPGADPVRSAMDGTFLASPYLNPNNPMAGGTLIDIAPLDVPVLWGVVGVSGSPASDKTPGLAGYGQNPIYGLNKNGTQYLDGNGQPWYHTLADLGTANLNTINPDSNTIFDTSTAWATVAILTNFGTGWQQADQSDVRHMLITGRAKNGENLMVITRDAGSGTRNGSNNTVGVDPSWGMGENIQGFNNSSADRLVGPNFQPSNKGGSGAMETTVLNCRLAIGYSGADRAINGYLTTGRNEILAIRNDLMGGTVYSRPNIDAVLDNNANGYVIGGPAVYATIGDPRNHNELGGDAANNNPRMRNSRAAAFLNNISRSIEAFVSVPSDPENFGMPGELMAYQLVLPGATDYVHDLNNPLTLLPNPNFNQTLQDYTRANNALRDPGMYTFGTYSLNGKVPTRTTLTGSNKYSDGNTSGYTSEGGSSVSAGANLTSRNRICGDFNGDGKRDLNDINDMVAAWKKRNGTGVWNAPNGSGAIAGAPGTDAIIEVLGDFNMDGNFGRIWDNTNLVYVPDTSDIRYFCDGLGKDPATGMINRFEAFRRVDVAFGGNFFGTTSVTGAAFTNGLAAADVSSASGLHTPGYNPIGQDGVVDANDLNYICKQFMNLGDRELNWDTIADAQGRDLSADVNGDLKVNYDDITKALQLMGTTKADVNLDGVVDLMDRCAINNNIGNVGGGWLAGDINCDGVTDVDDIAFAFDAYCQGDFDLNGFVNGDDYDAFASSFDAGDRCADFNGDGFVNGDDYDAFASSFDAGC